MTARQHRAPPLTVAEAAAQLGVDTRQVYHWISAGLLGCTQYPTRVGEPNGKKMVDQADVDAFRARYRQAATA